MKSWVLLLLASTGLVLASCAPVASPPPPPAAPALTSDPSAPIQISGTDLHDGMIARHGSTYYWYGTEYSCGFGWGVPGTPWCGFGVSTASSLGGPWSTPTLLFDPSTWQATCVDSGCFNPRMVQRDFGTNDGAFLLWFNAPGDTLRTGANAYYVMSCAGPTGPCSAPHKPVLQVCNAIGDFSIVTSPPNAWIICTTAGQTLDQEQLTPDGRDGTGVGTTGVAGLSSVEGVAAYQDPSGTWVLTYSDPECGFCGGTGTGYATAASAAGPWSARGFLSSTTCSGQPRSVDEFDGHPYEQIDQWYGQPNEAHANTALVALIGMTCPATQAPQTVIPGIHPFGNRYTP